MPSQKRWLIKLGGKICHDVICSRYRAVKLFDAFCIFVRVSGNQSKCTLEGWDI